MLNANSTIFVVCKNKVSSQQPFYTCIFCWIFQLVTVAYIIITINNYYNSNLNNTLGHIHFGNSVAHAFRRFIRQL